MTPQGLNCSGDSFNEITDDIFFDCKHFMLKEVDDIIIFAPDKQTLLNRLDEVCELVNKNSVSFSKDKLFLGQKTIFAGFEIDVSGPSPSLSPDPEKIRPCISP